MMLYKKKGQIHPPGFTLKSFGFTEMVTLRGKVEISYQPESNLMFFRTCTFLPKSQLDDFCRYETNITAFFAMSNPAVNSSNMQFSLKNLNC
jgi:hypothetical protein